MTMMVDGSQEKQQQMQSLMLELFRYPASDMADFCHALLQKLLIFTECQEGFIYVRGISEQQLLRMSVSARASDIWELPPALDPGAFDRKRTGRLSWPPTPVKEAGPEALSAWLTRGWEVEKDTVLCGWLGLAKKKTKESENDIFDVRLILDSLWEQILRIQREAKQQHLLAWSLNMHRVKSQLIRGLSMDIRSPMNAILGFLSLLQETPLQEEQQEYVAFIQRSSDSLWAYLQELHAIGEHFEDGTSVKVLPIELKKILKELVKQFQTKSLQQQVSMTFSLDERLEGSLMGKAIWIKLLLTQLLNYGLHTFPQGEFTLALRLEDTMEDIFQVSATLPLVASEDALAGIQKLLSTPVQADQRVQLSESETTLLLCKQFAKSLGGEVCLKRSGEAGNQLVSSFLLYPNVQEMQKRSAAYSFQGMRFLLVAGEERSRQQILESLFPTQSEVLCFHNGVETLLAMAKQREAMCPVDALLLTQTLMDMPAEALAKAIRAFPFMKHIPIFILPTESQNKTGDESKIQGLFRLAAWQGKALIKQMAVWLKSQEIQDPAPGITEYHGGEWEDERHPRILFVEQDSINIHFFEKMMEMEGIPFRVARNMPQLLPILENEVFDLIFIDCHFICSQEENMVLRIKALQAKGHVVRIIGMCSSYYKKEFGNFRAKGLDFMLEKPLDISSILKLIRNFERNRGKSDPSITGKLIHRSKE